MQKRRDPVRLTVVIHHSLLPPREPRPSATDHTSNGDDDSVAREDLKNASHRAGMKTLSYSKKEYYHACY